MKTLRFPRTVFVFGALLSLLALAACGGEDPGSNGGNGGNGDDYTDMERELYEAALDEGGVVVVWDTPDLREIESIFNAFTERYPGMEVEYFAGNANNQQERYILEHDSGSENVTVDAMSTMRPVQPILEEREAALDLTELAEDAGGEDLLTLDGYGYIAGSNSSMIVYNTNRVSEDQVPTTWQDLHDPRWEGDIVIEDRLQPYVLFTDVYDREVEGEFWSEAEAVDFLEQLGEQNPVFHNGNTATLQQVVSGEQAIMAGGWLASAWRIMEDGAPIDIAPIDVSPGETSPHWAPVDAPHPNASKLYMRWAMSEHGVQAKVDVHPEDFLLRPNEPSDYVQEKGINLQFAEPPEITDEYTRLQEMYQDTLGIQ